MKGKDLGDPNGCVTCHGEIRKRKEILKQPIRGPRKAALKTFNRHAASMAINGKTCKLSHQNRVCDVHKTNFHYAIMEDDLKPESFFHQMVNFREEQKTVGGKP